MQIRPNNYRVLISVLEMDIAWSLNYDKRKEKKMRENKKTKSTIFNSDKEEVRRVKLPWILEQRKRESDRRELLRKYIAKLLYKWNNGKFEEERVLFQPAQDSWIFILSFFSPFFP